MGQGAGGPLLDPLSSGQASLTEQRQDSGRENFVRNGIRGKQSTGEGGLGKLTGRNSRYNGEYIPCHEGHGGHSSIQHKKNAKFEKWLRTVGGGANWSHVLRGNEAGPDQNQGKTGKTVRI